MPSTSRIRGSASRTLPNSYPRSRVLEVIACSLPDAVAAGEGGADRLEICSRLDLQGITPPVELVESIIGAVRTPLRVMIRGGAGFTEAGEEAAVRSMTERSLELTLGIDGIVFGLLDDAGRLDFKAMDRVLRHIPDFWRWTLHRAFDYAAGSTAEKLAAVAAHGRADYILTATSWHLAPPADLQFIAGGGLNAANLGTYLHSPCREFHFGRAARTPAEVEAPVDAARVRELAEILQESP